MDTTPVFKLPYPDDEEGPDGPTQGKALADRLEELLEQALAPGTMVATGAAAAPSGWLLCEGQEVSRTTYARLFAVLGTAYGKGNNTSTFNLPDLRGRAPVGADGAAGRMSANDARGQSGGEEKHTLSEGELAPHAHGPGSFFVGGLWAPGQQFFNEFNTHSPQGGFNAVTTWGQSGAEAVQGGSGSTGSGLGHNNMQPYQVVSYMIKT